MSEQIFELKGNLFTLSVLHLFKNDINALVSQLDKKIAQIPKFFVGAPIVVNLQNLSNEKIDFITLKQSLSDLQLNLVGVCNGSEVQNSAAKEQQLSILN
jgi:septum site-determining protein MinC